jgi:hypothetical protein
LKKNFLSVFLLLNIKMATFGLKAALNIPKVNTGNASRYQSQRALDSQQLVCPAPTTVDNAGRPELPYSGFSTRTAGCYSALDQTLNENNLRPQFSELVQLNPQAIHNVKPASAPVAEYFDITPQLNQIGGVSGFGQQLGKFIQDPQSYERSQQMMQNRVNSGNY